MKYNYSLHNIVVNGLWFELDDDNKFLKIGCKTFYLYLSLFKFRVFKQEHDYLFHTSISLLRKETGYSTDEILEMLKLMKRHKILSFDGLSRWDMLIDEHGKIKDRELITCYSIDVPDTSLEGTRFVNVDPNMLEYYKRLGLHERYYAIYCLIRYQADRNSEKKSFTSIEKSAKFLDMDKDTFNKMIHEMNRKYILYSQKRRNGKGDYYFEHRICNTFEMVEKFKESDFIKSGIEMNIKQWDKAKERKAKSRKKKAE